MAVRLLKIVLVLCVGLQGFLYFLDGYSLREIHAFFWCSKVKRIFDP